MPTTREKASCTAPGSDIEDRPAGAAEVTGPASLLCAQWAGYRRYHQSRANLLLHIVFVPLFLAGNIALVIALIERRWLMALGCGIAHGAIDRHSGTRPWHGAGTG
jgi:hypothetical protein